MDAEIFDPRFMQRDGQQLRDTAIPRFYTQAVKDEARSKAEGSAIFADKEFVEIRVPGDKYNVIVREVIDEDRMRFSRQYEQFKKNLEQKPDGFPLEAWNLTTPSLVATLNAVSCFTVEQLAGMPESSLPKYHNILKIQKSAQEFLQAKDDAKVIQKLQLDIDGLKKQLADRDDTIASLKDAIAQLQDKRPEPEIRRGRAA